MKRLIYLVAGMLLLGNTALATSDLIGQTKYELIPPPSAIAPGPVTIQLVLYPSGQTGSIKVDVIDYDNVIYSGVPRYDLQYSDKAPVTIDIDLNIPANDTTSVYIGLDESANVPGQPKIRLTGITRYFISDESTVTVFDRDPRPVRDYELEALRRRRDSARAVRDSVREARLHPGVDLPWNGWSGPLVTGRDSAGNEVWDSVASELLRQSTEPAKTQVARYSRSVGKIKTASRKFVGSGFVAGEIGHVIVASHTVSGDTMAFCPASSQYCVTMVRLRDIPGTDISTFAMIGYLPVDTLRLGRFDDLVLGEQVRVLGWHSEQNTMMIQDATILRKGLSLLHGDTVKYIEVSASGILPGCSGGPVLNTDDEVIGILSEGWVAEDMNTGERTRIARCVSIDPLQEQDSLRNKNPRGE